MFHRTKTLFAATALAAGTLATPAMAQDVTIGWTAWSDAEFVTKLAQRLMEDEMGLEVELVQTDIAPQYQGVASGDIDVMLMSWQPNTHADYVDQVGADTVNLGILYEGAQLGWVVPNYVPEDQVASIADLTKDGVADQLDGRIQGIDPGAGLMRLSNDAMEAYGLDDYELISASGAAMTAALDRAVNRDEWIVVTGWTPHWMFGAYDLRMLEDPEGVLGGVERIMAVAREGFYQDTPEAAAFLSRMYLPLETLQSYMFDARETSYDEAITAYIEENGARVNYWVTGEMPSS